MNTIKAFLATTSVLALLAAAPVSALSVSTGATGNTNVTVGTGVSVNVGASTDSSTSGSTTNDNTNTTGNAELSVPLVVTQADVSAGNVQATTVSAGDVQTKGDLSGYIAAKMQSDANLSAVDTASDHVAVTYKEPATFLGVFPITVDTTATTDASGNVTITQPWWAFLASTNSAALQANVQSSVDSVLGASAQTNTELSASQQAQLVSAIQATLSAAASANVSSSATAQ